MDIEMAGHSSRVYCRAENRKQPVKALFIPKGSTDVQAALRHADDSLDQNIYALTGL
jgi:hypothetical protein